VFSGGVSAAAEGPGKVALSDERLSVVLHAGSPGDVCFTFKLPDETHEGCASVEDIRTGLVYVATQSHGGPVDMIGLVPDDVGTVHVGGRELPVQNNVWHYVARAGDDLAFEVESLDGSVRATLGS
jgi:hypothetical protein